MAMPIKGEVVESGTAEDIDDEVTEVVTDKVVKEIRRSLERSIDDLEIDISESIGKAVNKHMTDWLRARVEDEAYMHIAPIGDKIHVYISLPVGTGGVEDDPSWLFDLDTALNDLFADEDGGDGPISEDERERMTKTRDAFQRLIDLYNRELEKRK